jgi:hypothetical protein
MARISARPTRPVTVCEELLADRLKVPGPDHCDRLATRRCIARLHRQINQSCDG